MRSKYFIDDYFQKSKHFLLPLISKSLQQGLINTYLFGDYVKEDIVDYYLLCELEENVILNEDLHKYVYKNYITEDNTQLIILTLETISEEVDKFLEGRYSEYSIDSKNSILKIYNWITDIDKAKELYKKDKSELHFYVILYPNKFKKEYSEELFNIEFKGTTLFENKEDCLKAVKEMKELCLLYDVDKETFKKKIKEHE